MEKSASFFSYLTAGATAAVGALTLQDVTMIVGIATALGTFAVNWYYKAKEARRLERSRE